MSDFLAMGGYAAYVWTSYAIFIVVLAADSLAPILRRKRVIEQLRARFARARARQDSQLP